MHTIFCDNKYMDIMLSLPISSLLFEVVFTDFSIFGGKFCIVNTKQVVKVIKAMINAILHKMN